MSIESVVLLQRIPALRTDYVTLTERRDELDAELQAFLDGTTEVDPVDDLFAVANTMIAELRDQSSQLLADGSDRDAAGVLAVCERVRRGVEAIIADTVTAVEERELYRADGHRRTTGFITASVATSPNQAYQWVRLAHLIGLFPPVGELLAAGKLGIAAAYELARLTANPRITDEMLVAVLPGFVDHARHCPFESLRSLVREWERLVDADGARQSADEAHDNRDVKLSRVFNTVYLDGRFGTAQGVQFEAIWQHFIDAEFTRDWNDAKAVYGDATCVAVLARTDRQRRADALLAMAHAAATAPIDGTPIDVTVDILIDQATFEAQLAEMAGGTPPTDLPDPGARRMCTTIDGTPIDPRDAVTAAVVGHVRRVVIGSDGVIINLGRKRRCYTGSSRVAAMLQAGLDHHGRCSYPGCRTRRIQIDHSQEWVAHGGNTDVVNSGPECEFHNKWKSTGRYVTRRDTNGHWHTYRPDGTELHPY